MIVGRDGGMAAQFSRAAYDRQLSTPLRPGSAETQREPLSAEEIVTNPQVRLGWIHYSRLMDQIDVIRVSQGLPNLQVAAAEPLRRIKDLGIAALAIKYPAWYQDFSVVDRQRWARTIEGARAIAADERLAGRPEIQGLRKYLEARDLMVRVLQARGAQGGAETLAAASNADLRLLWETIVARIVEQNPAFADLYYRRLERDPLTTDPLAAEGDVGTVLAEVP